IFKKIRWGGGDHEGAKGRSNREGLGISFVFSLSVRDFGISGALFHAVGFAAMGKPGCLVATESRKLLHTLSGREPRPMSASIRITNATSQNTAESMKP